MEIEVQKHKFKREVFDPKKLLPQNVILKSVDSPPYRIGLSLFQTNESVRRKDLHNPKLIFIIELQLFIRQIISLYASEKDPQFFVYIGDLGYFYTRIHVAVAIAFITFLVLSSQILHYLNYKNGIKPSYLKPLQMISGLVSPQSIGLTNKEEIYKLVKVSKILFVVIKIRPAVMFGCGFVISFVLINNQNNNKNLNKN